MSGIDRRRFLGLSGAAAAAGLLGAVVPRGSASAASAASGSSGRGRFADFGLPANRTLIVIDMEGGNDALNTVVPQAGAYHDLRPTIGLADEDLLTFDGLDYGVNPALAELRPMWDADRLTAVYGVGLPEQSRSHFVAQDAWRSARPGSPATSGWLGRWLEATRPADEIPLRAISLGRSTLAAQSETGRPVAVQSVEGYRLAPPGGASAVVDAVLAMAAPRAAGTFGEAQAAIPETVESVELLQGLIAGAAARSSEYGQEGSSGLFSAAQAIIQADVGTQVLYITVPGFDTHASQRALQDDLLSGIARNVARVFADLEATGHADRTLVLTVSEFGRRAAENASAGTDHGNGGLALLLGPAVTESTVVGGADLASLDQGDLPVVVDTRSVYRNALSWLGAGDGVIDEVLGAGWASLDLLQPH